MASHEENEKNNDKSYIGLSLIDKFDSIILFISFSLFMPAPLCSRPRVGAVEYLPPHQKQVTFPLS